MSHETTTVANAITISQGIPKTDPLPINANGKFELNIVLSSPNSRASPRTAVMDPRVTMNGGSRMNAIMPPLIKPSTPPANSAATTPNMPQPGASDTISATIADAASTAPTERLMPPERITNVIPAASTVLIEAC